MLNKELLSLAEKTVKSLDRNNLKIATAESCTGGMVSAYITAVPHVSDVFEMGITTYSCRIKNEKLGVKAETLEEFGAVSSQTAAEMAENVRKTAKSDIGVSVTGVAGPDSSEGHPPGYVFIGLSSEDKLVTRLLDIEPLGRNFIREKAVEAVFNLIINYIEESKE